MNSTNRVRVAAVALALGLGACAGQQVQTSQVPQFRVTADWPRPLPEENGMQLILGQVAGLAVDRRGHVWLLHRPA